MSQVTIGSAGTGEKAQALEGFARRVVESRVVWAVSTSDGLLGAQGVDGSSAQPFWSSRERAEEMIALAATPVMGIRIVEIPLDEFVHRSLQGLAEAQVLVGLDWGTDRKGWVFEAETMRTQLRQLIHLRLN